MIRILSTLILAASLCACASHQWPTEAAPFDAIKPDGVLQMQVKYRTSEGKPQGSADIKVHLGTDGRAKYVLLERSSGHRGIDEAAVELAWNTSFKPYQRNGLIVEATAIVPVHFNGK